MTDQQKAAEQRAQAQQDRREPPKETAASDRRGLVTRESPRGDG